MNALYNKTVADNPSAASDRGFIPSILSLLAGIRHHGCWCYLDTDWKHAKGSVQDEYDQECKNLVLNYRCLVLDAHDRGEVCDPATQTYVRYNLFIGSGDVVLDCSTNGNELSDVATRQCQIDLCIADSQFTLNMFNNMFQAGGVAGGDTYDPTLAHVQSRRLLDLIRLF